MVNVNIQVKPEFEDGLAGHQIQIRCIETGSFPDRFSAYDLTTKKYVTTKFYFSITW
jgi:hypothetical protein